MKIHLQWKKETKGTHVYQEVNAEGEELNATNGAVIQSMYIRKTAMKDPENRPDTFEFELPID